jgi:hypothetical protein|uniref:Uncharacterized protein n=1 Tax=Desulfomonile tiedjei TaxID=2358 RepID=A0A7C4ASS5_9BACT
MRGRQAEPHSKPFEWGRCEPLFLTSLLSDLHPGEGEGEPSIAEKAPDEDRAQLIREPLAIEREIAEELKK